MLTKIHPIAAFIATLCIAIFFTSTITVELFGSAESIATVKSLIVLPGLLILVPAIAVAGISGVILGKNRKGRLVQSKQKRMPFIGVNGLFVLMPAAIFLDQWATQGLFDTRFYIVQVVELLAGAINLTLLGMNMRDGLRMTGKLRSLK